MHVKLGGLKTPLLTVVAFVTAATVAAGCKHTLRIEEPAPQDIETSVFLIGDAGEPDPRDIGAPLESLTVQAAVAPQKSLIVFLGDNIYPAGIPEEGQAEFADARRRLDAQVQAVPIGARGIFIPGNHDWGHEEAYGLYSIRRQERLIAALARGRDVRMLPGNGCPGPSTVDVGRLRLIVLDTQWWLHNFIVRDSATNCGTSMGGVTAELRRQVQPTDTNRVVMVAAHHPLMTGGEHGGYCGATGPFRRFAGRSQDVLSKVNLRMRDSIEQAMLVRRPLVYASGHDHSLQVLDGGRSVDYILVSGAGSDSKSSCAVVLRESHYTSPHRNGFMRIDIMRDKGALLRVYRYTRTGSGGLAYSRWLEFRP
jgi:hypothetical protein